jgi:hypothetical protein
MGPNSSSSRFSHGGIRVVAIALWLGCGEATEPEQSPAPVATVVLSVANDPILVRSSLELVAGTRK